LYTAPSTITSAQNVMLTATSLADATKTAVAVIALALVPPPLTISLTAPVLKETPDQKSGVDLRRLSRSNPMVCWDELPDGQGRFPKGNCGEM
jgi:hypothetical protein